MCIFHHNRPVFDWTVENFDWPGIKYGHVYPDAYLEALREAHVSKYYTVAEQVFLCLHSFIAGIG
jgi:hypothetical protein